MAKPQLTYLDVVRGRLSAVPLSFAEMIAISVSDATFAEHQQKKAQVFIGVLKGVSPGPHEDLEQLTIDLKQLANEAFYESSIDYLTPEFAPLWAERGWSWEQSVAPRRALRNEVLADVHSRIDAIMYEFASSRVPLAVPTPSRREARKTATQRRHANWQEAYEKLRKKNPTEKEEWCAQEIAKLPIAEGARYTTILRHMKPSVPQKFPPESPDDSM